MISLMFIFIFIKSSISIQEEHEKRVENSDNIWYEISEDSQTITFKGTGILTVSIAKSAQNKKKIIIDEGITEIENKAFYQSWHRRKDEEFNYEEVELPRSLIRIGYLSFKTQGHSLRRVHFPENKEKSDSFYSLHEIGDYAFSCQQLKEHNIPNTFTILGHNAFESTDITHIEFNNKLNSIPNYAFLFCKSLTEIELPESITSIGISSFENCKNLKKISWKSNEVNEFGYNSFYGCVSLEEFKFPKKGNGFSSTGFFFENCIKLTKCEFPSEVKNDIGRGTFMNCINLKEVKFPENLKRVPCDFLRNTSIEFAYLPTSVCEIGTKAFSFCNKLRYVHISHRGTIHLDAEVFFESNNIEIAVIDGNISRIEERNLVAKVLCYNGIENPIINDIAFDTSKTKIFLTSRFADNNPNEKFGNSSFFDGYEYEFQKDGTCKLPDQHGKKKILSTLEIVLIVVGVVAALLIVAAIVTFIVIKKKRTNFNVVDQALISESQL